MLVLASAVPVSARPFHDEISQVFRGTWAPSLAVCRDAEGVEQFVIDGESVNYYEGNDYLMIGLKFSGAMTKRGGSGALLPRREGASCLREPVDHTGRDRDGVLLRPNNEVVPLVAVRAPVTGGDLDIRGDRGLGGRERVAS